MRLQQRTHTSESFSMALNECLYGDYKKKGIRRRQLRQLLVDMGACTQRKTFNGLTLREAWEQATGDQLAWFLRRVLLHAQPQNAGPLANIIAVADALKSSPREKATTTNKRVAQALRYWFRPDGTLRRTWHS